MHACNNVDYDPWLDWNPVLDLNKDGSVNILDVIILAGAFGAEPGDTNWNPDADINGDDVVNILDAIIVAGHFGKTC